MVAWSLSALEAQTPQLWAAELAFISACPAGSMDEVGLDVFVSMGSSAPSSLLFGPLNVLARGCRHLLLDLCLDLCTSATTPCLPCQFAHRWP